MYTTYFCSIDRGHVRAIFFFIRAQAKITPDSRCYGNAMRACAARGNWQLALALLNTMKKEGVPRMAFNYNVVMQVVIERNRTKGVPLGFGRFVKSFCYSVFFWSRSPLKSVVRVRFSLKLQPYEKRPRTLLSLETSRQDLSADACFSAMVHPLGQIRILGK